MMQTMSTNWRFKSWGAWISCGEVKGYHSWCRGMQDGDFGLRVHERCLKDELTNHREARCAATGADEPISLACVVPFCRFNWMQYFEIPDPHSRWKDRAFSTSPVCSRINTGNRALPALIQALLLCKRPSCSFGYHLRRVSPHGQTKPEFPRCLRIEKKRGKPSNRVLKLSSFSSPSTLASRLLCTPH